MRSRIDCKHLQPRESSFEGKIRIGLPMHPIPGIPRLEHLASGHLSFPHIANNNCEKRKLPRRDEAMREVMRFA